MKNIKFVAKVNRGRTLAPEYVRRVELTPIQMTRKPQDVHFS